LFALQQQKGAHNDALAEAHVDERRPHLCESIRMTRRLSDGSLATCDVVDAGDESFARGEPALDECIPEHTACGVGVVGLAEQTEIFDGRGTSQRKRVAVFEGQEPPLLAAATSGIDEGALAAVALPDLLRYGERDVARTRSKLHASTRLAGTNPPLELALDELVEGTFEEQRQVTVRQSVARELPRLLELRAERRTRGEFDAIAFR
jgi:hypothetical protein